MRKLISTILDNRQEPLISLSITASVGKRQNLSAEIKGICDNTVLVINQLRKESRRHGATLSGNSEEFCYWFVGIPHEKTINWK